ncbi:hypothetical protein NP493_1254g00010 [Ridgeia piscesae]|uniref:pyridoxal 5'-phosphate synthase n=1 Tax=Ridgeia piscesae TaxID=27915 RepID=A0AAD9NEZ1_RIDPI|nr:hypothetical protein NP493_1254g00010 [Ridgeia piscesae]
MVLLNGFHDNGLQFFTKYTSKKGRDLEENPYACMMFFWEALYKVVRIQGSVEKLSEEVSTKHFHMQPRHIQLTTFVSPQSSPIAETFGADFGAAMEKFKDELIPIPKPETWGGYLLKPDHVEFWQGHADRFPDRFVFRKPAREETVDPRVTHEGDNGWWYERLAP